MTNDKQRPSEVRIPAANAQTGAPMPDPRSRSHGATAGMAGARAQGAPAGPPAASAGRASGGAAAPGGAGGPGGGVPGAGAPSAPGMPASGGSALGGGALAGAGVQAVPAQGNRKRTVLVVVGIVLVAVVIWLLVWLFACNGSSLFDPTAQTGQAPYKSEEEMQAELDRTVEEGMFNISISSVIQFDDGAASGTAYIENVPGNRYNMQVTITDDDSGEVLYESGVLAPNQFIEKITLAQDLDEGTYPATATFRAIDPTTYDEVGQAAAKVTISVLG